jgi:hypothetical protein
MANKLEETEAGKENMANQLELNEAGKKAVRP